MILACLGASRKARVWVQKSGERGVVGDEL